MTDTTPQPDKPLDETKEGGRYLSEAGVLVDANGQPVDEKDKLKDKSKDTSPPIAPQSGK